MRQEEAGRKKRVIRAKAVHGGCVRQCVARFQCACEVEVALRSRGCGACVCVKRSRHA